MPEESWAVQKALGGKYKIINVGMMARHPQEIRKELQLKPCPVLLAGVCGALNPKLKSGDAITATEVVNIDKSQGSVAPSLASPIHGVWSGRVICTSHIVQTTGEKKELHKRFGADVVDMESFLIASLCAEFGVPFHFLKTVSDDANLDLPDFNSALLAEGSFDKQKLHEILRADPVGAARVREGLNHALESLSHQLTLIRDLGL